MCPHYGDFEILFGRSFFLRLSFSLEKLFFENEQYPWPADLEEKFFINQTRRISLLSQAKGECSTLKRMKGGSQVLFSRADFPVIALKDRFYKNSFWYLLFSIKEENR